MKITEIRLRSISILTMALLLHTGCSVGLFDDAPKKQVTKPMATSLAPNPSLMQIAPECSDDLNTNSACKKGLIKPKELKPKKMITKTGGEVHKLQSIQGGNITVVERSNGYLFPEFKNKIVILKMFGKNCSHCIKEMPMMNRLRRQYRNRLEIVALQVEERMSPLQANAMIKRHQISYPIISGDTATNLQYHVQNNFGWTGVLPFMMVIKNGVTEFTYKGKVTYDEINADIRLLLN